ncbi:MAG: glycosyltransferase family 25 protein [Alphaproteobacteria bacterium]
MKNLSVYLINLDRSPDRLEKMTQKFNEVGLPFERFSGIDGKLLPKDIIAKIRKNQRWIHPLSLGEIGCYKSHMDVLQHFLENTSDEFLFVAEDDLYPDSHIVAKLNIIMENWNPDCDMLKMAEFYHRIGEVVQTIPMGDEVIEIYRPLKINAATACHLVSRKGALKILENLKYRRPFDIDLQTLWENNLTIYQTSDVHNRRALWGEDSIIGKRKKPTLTHIHFKLWFYWHNMLYNIKHWGFFKTIYLLLLYRLKKHNLIKA